jgi:glucose-6-phosphate 1-dehydrogenase
MNNFNETTNKENLTTVRKIDDPYIFTLFGASGDLAKLKIFPAFHTLYQKKLLPTDFLFIGYARSAKTHEEFREEFKQSILDKNEGVNTESINELLSHVYYFQGQYDSEDDFKKYYQFITELTTIERQVAYFSVPPIAFKSIIQNLSLNFDKQKTQLIIEKPFGEDQESAKELYHFVNLHFPEENIYLLDHYLGKNSIRSIIDLRYANRILNKLLSPKEIENIQITATENIGIANRVGYFDQVGIIKDMIQSHLIQILSLITSTLPSEKKTENIHREKAAIISALSFEPSKTNIVIGQYNSYRNEQGIPENSKTETFASVKVKIAHNYWNKIPIYFRTGKKLDQKTTNIVIQYKKWDFQDEKEQPNYLLISLQPEEYIQLRLYDYGNSVDLDLHQSIACVGDLCLPEHATLLLDVINKNRMNFLSFPEIVASWELIDSIVRYIKDQDLQPELYEDGSIGPVLNSSPFNNFK